MNINLEQIDELRKRADVSYEDAKDALERFDGNMVDSLIYLEKNKRIKSCGYQNHHHGYNHGNGDFFEKVKGLWKKGNKIRFIVTIQDKTLLNLPLAVSLIIAMLTLHYSIVVLVLALIFGCRFKFKNGTEEMKVNETLNKVHDNIDGLKKKFTQEA